jgi:hypothetical protein
VIYLLTTPRMMDEEGSQTTCPVSGKICRKSHALELRWNSAFMASAIGTKTWLGVALPRQSWELLVMHQTTAVEEDCVLGSR